MKLFSEETRLKISKALKGRKFTPEWKAKISKANKGKHNSPDTEIKKGQRISTETEFKGIGYIFNGTKTQYRNLHAWIQRHFGSPDLCEMCGIEKLNRYEWANISGKYTKDRSDWIRLCKKCHFKFDKEKREHV